MTKLPLDGSKINRELARTFNPSVAVAPASSGSQALNRHLKTQYEDDFGDASMLKGCHRPPSLKPATEKHVHENAKLLYMDSVTHEAYRTPQPGFVAKSQPVNPLEGATSGITGSPFCAKTRYSEEFLNLGSGGYRVEVARGRDDSNRVNGASVPNRIREYMFTHHLQGPKGIDVDAIMRSNETRKKVDSESVYYDNPYLSDYLST